MSSNNKGKINVILIRTKVLRIGCQQSHPVRMAKGNTLNRNRIVTEISEHKEERKNNKRVKIWINKMDFPFPLELLKLCLTVEAKLVKLYDMVLLVLRKYLRSLYDKWRAKKGTGR